MMKKIALVLLLAAASGCTPYDKQVGSIQSWNIAQHTVNPDPVYPPEATQDASGERMATAVRRYESGTVRDPVGTTTTNRAGSSGSGPR